MRRVRQNMGVFVLGFVSCALAFRFLVPLPVGAASPERYVFTTPAKVAAAVGSAVVSLDVYPVGPDSASASPWTHLLGIRAPGESEPNAVASGVIIAPDGYVVTNNHVVEDSGSVRARLSDGREVRASLVGRDPHSDLAVLKLPGHGYTAAQFGDSRAARPGDPVVAIGNPLGFENSVSTGIVSAVRAGPFRVDGHVLGDMIQTDAAINQGNSGGGLFGADGKLIGVNTAIMASGSTGSIGIGFAIPAHQAQPVVETLIRRRRLPRPWLGILYRPGEVNSLIHEVRHGFGVMIEDVTPGGPAERAGIQPTDILRRLGDCPIRSADDIYAFVGSYQPGQRVRAQVYREGKARTVSLVLGEKP